MSQNFSCAAAQPLRPPEGRWDAAAAEVDEGHASDPGLHELSDRLRGLLLPLAAERHWKSLTTRIQSFAVLSPRMRLLSARA
jgi:hypothetical protein